MTCYAHSMKARPLSEWQLLEDHLAGVASRAGAFASPFGSSAWARLAGLLHDVGKSRIAFQNYLKFVNEMEDAKYDASDHSHSGAGAAWATAHLGKLGRIFAYLIAGHHSGLADWANGSTPNGSISVRMSAEGDGLPVLGEKDVADFVSLHEQEWKEAMQSCRPPWRFALGDVSFWIRMLYSCLVDADFLDTESFCSPAVVENRHVYPALSALSELFFAALDEKQRKASDTPVNRIRAEIREDCEKAAALDPGLFSLTVPTGGGKTLSGTAFAFRHAMAHGLKRIIYVIPYTSIIEQTADVLRGILGDENVVEHHSNLDPDKETQSSRLASENWDAPVVVTTSVQFFESLYACKPSRCRKLHNLAQSVVVLDEVQLLPPELITPCTEAIKQLAEHYGVSVVLSTATQPALPGLENVREIISPERDLYGRLKRVNIEFPEEWTVRRSWEDVASELSEHEKVLCVVNTRADCLDLFGCLPEEGRVHLSASMCGAHRAKVIADIKRRLSSPGPLRVVSTQLVEAGVDIDFPVVYRAFAGLSSIVQTAGRCNREGGLADGLGKVVVFMPPKESPRGLLRFGEYATEDVISRQGFSVDDPAVYPEFFKAFYERVDNHGEELLDLLTKDARDFQFQFREATAKFRMIDDKASAAVVVRYGESESLIRTLSILGVKRDIMRKLQRYTVAVPHRALERLVRCGLVTLVGGAPDGSGGVYVQEDSTLYSNESGLDIKRELMTPEDLIV